MERDALFGLFRLLTGHFSFTSFILNSLELNLDGDTARWLLGGLNCRCHPKLFLRLRHIGCGCGTSLTDTSFNIEMKSFKNKPFPGALERKIVFSSLARPFTETQRGGLVRGDTQCVRGWQFVKPKETMVCRKGIDKTGIS